MRGEGEDGVSPVIGTILVLAITVVGIGALMVWGGPTIDRVQSQNAAFAMQGEFEGLRDASQDLSVPDHSRFPSVALPRGTLGIADGTRFMVAASHDPDPAYQTCDLHVTGWGGDAADDSVDVQATGCRTGTFEVHQVEGTTISLRQASLLAPTATVAGADFSQGDWLFRLTDGAANPVVYAQAWLHSSDRIEWDLQTSQGTHNIYLEGGAIFTAQDGSIFLGKAPPISDSSSGAGYYGLWLRTFGSSGATGLNEPGTHQVFLSLSTNDLHVDEDDVRRVRLTFSGDLAESWCTLLVQRNRSFPAGFPGTYTADTTASCPTGDLEGLRSVTFAYTADAPFKMRFLHARIQASLVP